MIDLDVYMIAVRRLLWAILVSCAIGSTASAGEKQTIDAFSVWQGQGDVYKTGAESATFVGAISGLLFVETEQGPADAGRILCPATMELSLKDGKQVGSGKCTIIAEDGARAYADWTCRGVHMVGCDGQLTLTGGTERFSGVVGGGPMTVRSSLQKVALKLSSDVVAEGAAGIMVWRGFTYELK
jgi:hypothetical protein